MALEANDIFFRYDRKGPWILEHYSFRIERGERVALLAPSGSGKTTLAMLLAGWRTPARGRILLDGHPLPEAGVCPVRFICQHPETAVNPRWRLGRTLAEGGPVRDELLDALGIEHAWLSRFPAELSGGELQRFCVARALTRGADYLICDEISAMLDVITQAQIWNVILAEAKKQSSGVLMITHNRHLAARIADRIETL
ncbi:MAG: ATP-binding cassette domain-containing protein [Roseburia sp.]|jgi:peptide/nickel transport system ATP-binding protein|nr:ATP-binding cassette domain-containing protein [Roseburia sp.]